MIFLCRVFAKVLSFVLLLLLFVFVFVDLLLSPFAPNTLYYSRISLCTSKPSLRASFVFELSSGSLGSNLHNYALGPNKYQLR